MDIVAVPLTQGQFAIIDAADAERVLRHPWRLLRAPRTCYATTTMRCPDGVWRDITLHRFIAEPSPDEEVDHWDHDGLNNRRSNLVVCTRAEHAQRQRMHRDNRTGFLGVTRPTVGPGWVARICHQRRNIHLGTFATPEEAARAYDAKSRELRGHRATLNFPD